MSVSNISNDLIIDNKVLPHDKSGLPWEVWQWILSWLSASDLCRVACVCKTWGDLVISVDSTRWRELYMGCSEWRHPYWPLSTTFDPPSWRAAYRDQLMSTKFWLRRRSMEARGTMCVPLFKTHSLRHTYHVGPGLEHQTVRSALSVAGDYDRIVVHPGIYDESFEVTTKIPCELIGHGELGSVILVLGIQQLARSVRLSNLVLRAPWFTSFIVMMSSGYLQIDNCILEDGMVCAQAPSTVHIKFCTFRHATVILQHMNTSIIENCEFSQSDTANIIVEGHPKEERNWTYTFLREHTAAIYQQKRSLHRKKPHGLKPTSSMTSTLHSSFTGKSAATAMSNQVMGSVSRDPSVNFDDPGAMFLNPHIFSSRHGNSDKDGAVGCGDLHSMYQEQSLGDNLSDVGTKSRYTQDTSLCSATSDLHDTKTETADNRTDNRTDNNSGRSLQRSKPQTPQRQPSHDSLPLPDQPEIHSRRSGSLDADNYNPGDVAHRHIRNNFRRKSIGSCSLQQLDEDSCNTKILNSNFDSVCLNPNNVKSETEKASSMKRLAGRRLSTDSRVEFQLDSDGHIVDRRRSVGDFFPGKPYPLFERFGTGCYSNMNHSEMSESISLTGEDRTPIFPQDHNSMLAATSFGIPVNDHSKSYICHDTSCKVKNESVIGRPHTQPDQHCPCSSIYPQNVTMATSSGHGSGSLTSQQGDEGTSSAVNNLKSTQCSCCTIPSNRVAQNEKLSNLITPQINSSVPVFGFPTDTILSDQASLDETPESLVSMRQEARSSASLVRDSHGQDTLAVNDPRLGLGGGNGLYGAGQFPPLRRSQSEEVLSESEDEEELSILDELDGGSGGSSHHSDIPDGLSSSTDSSDMVSMLQHSGTDEDFSDSEESVIMLPHLREFHMEHSTLATPAAAHVSHSSHSSHSPQTSQTSPRGIDAEVTSINSDCTRPVPVNVSEDDLMSSYVGQIQGCLIHQCRMNHSKGGLMVSLQAHAVVSECDVSNVGYGIRCIQNSRVVILKNKIHHCRTSGIFMRLAASGLIAGNDIHSNNEAGLDIRKGADPLVQYNQIHHGKRSGVVILGSGRGHIKRNDIYANAEAGVYVLYGGNPTISENYIYDGRAAGVAINAGGKGCIVDNVIRHNQWGGIDIRNGSCPLISGNSIVDGVSDGIVVGVGGKGSVENNFICGNGGCGLWMMAAKHLYIHGNQICNSGHCGVMLLDKTISTMEGHLGQLVAVNHRTFSQYDDDFLVPEPKTSWAVLQYNNIFHNKGRGIHIEIKDEVRLFYNAIHGNQKDGIVMAQDAPAVIDGNSVTNNGGSGIITSVYNKVRMCGNGVYDNGQHGVVCRNIVTLEDNDIVGHSMCAVLVEAKSVAHVLSNRLCSSGQPAVRGMDAASITATGNKIFDRGGGDFFGKNLVAKDNILTRPTLTGVTPSRKQAMYVKEFCKTEFLSSPAPRPHLAPPPPSTSIPPHHTSHAPQVPGPSTDTCHKASRFCLIL